VQLAQREAARIHVLGQPAGQALIERSMLHVDHHCADARVADLVGDAVCFDLRRQAAHADVASAVSLQDE